MRWLAGAVFLIGGLAVPAAAQQPAAPQAVPVGTVVAALKPVTKSADFVGRVQSINRVEVRARVTGFLDAVLFTEGDIVKENQPLYRIEKDQFQATVDQAQGALASSEAKKQLTAIQFQRAEDLMKTNAGTVVARDQALTADRAADAQILIDKANLESAKINLGYTDILSPITGKIGRTAITKGNVVGPDSGTLTIIVSQDPMYVLFPVSQRALMRSRGPDHPIDVSNIKLNLTFTDGTTYGETGKIDFVGVTVDQSTDTVQVRGVFPNPKGGLIDGQLVNVSVAADKPQEEIVVPQAALITDQQGLYVFVADNGKAEIRRVKTGQADGEDIVITDGLKAGDLVIVEGTQTLRPGVPVQARPMQSTLNRS
ncbi:MAG TPA: efflux RND transporter periplasmic adaptor subunit [Stellaceae bacterium]|nr:efflux RND transporter periplasmic adaptor subunit [Stellaceae bacterium]